VRRFIYTSTTSTFGRALTPPAGRPSAWIDEEVAPLPKNVYGVTKVAAEDVCQLVHRDSDMACLILRTSRFFCEDDDRAEIREAYADENVKVNELLYRRVDLDDVVSAHVAALERAGAIGFGRYIISATSPFRREDMVQLNVDAPSVVRRMYPDYPSVYEERGWSMFPGIDRVYVNDRARRELGWSPHYDFRWALDRLLANEDPRSPLAISIGTKGYQGASTYPYRPGASCRQLDTVAVGGGPGESTGAA
jgi:nucleoside-diphosphate-sugar epimerase